MAIITKPNTFSPSVTISSAEVNADFDEIYNLLSAGDTTVQAKIRATDGNTPLILDTTSGHAQEWQSSSTTKLRVNSNGTLESLIPTGTAPFVVASETTVTNLSADKLDGLDASDFAQIVSGVLEISDASPTLRFTDSDGTDFDLLTKLVSGVNALVVRNKDGATDVMSINSAGKVVAEGQIQTTVAAPVVSADLTRKDYVDSRIVPIAIVFFFPGTANVSAPRPSFVVPTNATNLNIRRIRTVYQAGTNQGTTTIQWILNGVAKDSVSITTQAMDTLVSTDVNPDVALSVDDILYAKITAAGSHADITMILTGDMTVA